MIYFELFYVFFLIGLFTFGGGYAMIPLIEEQTITRGWLDKVEFMNMIAISESTPGPIAVNMATFVGNLQGGILGSLCATVGVILPSFIIILLVATLMTKLINRPVVKSILHGFRGVVIGLIAATAIWFLYQDIIGVNEEGNIMFLLRPFIIFIIILLISLIFKLIRKKNMSPYILLLIGGGLGFIVLYLIP